jgi:hypothetical protein
VLCIVSIPVNLATAAAAAATVLLLLLHIGLLYSLKRRGLLPYESQPAFIQGYRLAFQLGGYHECRQRLDAANSMPVHIVGCCVPVMCRLNDYSRLFVIVLQYWAAQGSVLH